MIERALKKPSPAIACTQPERSNLPTINFHVTLRCILMISMITMAMLISSTAALALDIPLHVKETQGVQRTAEMVHNGIPIAKADNLTSVSGLALSDGDTPIPVTFEVLARWGGAKEDTGKPIKWLLVSFPASVSANGTRIYYLRDHGPAASINDAISVTQQASAITIDTGAASFVISKTAMTLFDSIHLNGNIIGAGNGGSYSTINGQAAAQANSPSITIERQNEHYVCIKAVGTYANTPVGSTAAEPLHYRMRYEFFAGSPTAVMTHKFFWPGYSGSANEDGSIIVQNVNLTLPDPTGSGSSDVYATAAVNYTGIAGESVAVSQDRRALFADPHRATVSHGGTSQTTPFATEPAVIRRTANGAMVATIGNMKFFEPQSITADPVGRITMNVMADAHDFAEVQGTWARIGVGALSSTATFDDVRAEIIAPVDHRLMAIPSAAYLTQTDFADRLPDPASQTPEIAAWWTVLSQICATTETWLDSVKFHGLMTWGGLVRYDHEMGDGTQWDKIYAGATLTDYHNTWKEMTIHGLLAADPAQLQNYAFNGARRMLHTQIFQADDYSNPSSAYMGWAPGGYHRYREDFNSSHSYFENLYLYYFLTGDLEVVDLLTVSAATKANWYTRSAGVLNNETEQGVSFVDYVGRVFHQTSSTFEFIGHAGDANYLDDWVHLYNHQASSNLLLLTSADVEYGFFHRYDDESPTAINQAWMDALYTTEGLYRLYLEYGDLELGVHDLRISRMLAAVGRGFWRYNRTTHSGSDGTWEGSWSNIQTVTYSGDRVGGTIDSVAFAPLGDDHLYTDGKGGVATTMVRGGALSGDQTLKESGLSGLTWLSTNQNFLNCSSAPLGKVAGLTFSRLGDGMSYFEGSGGDNTPRAPTGFTVE